MSPLPPDLRSIGPELMEYAGGPVRGVGVNAPFFIFFFLSFFVGVPPIDPWSMASCHIWARCSLRLVGGSGPGTHSRNVAFRATALCRSRFLVCVGVWPGHRGGGWDGYLPLRLLSFTVDRV